MDEQNKNTRLIVCGGRDFNDRMLCFKELDRLATYYCNMEIISGHASGADKLGEEYAACNNIPLVIFKAEWNKYGRAAGPVRNQQMLDYAILGKPAVIAFWDGNSKGTKNMIDKAKRSGAEVHVVYYMGCKMQNS